MNFKRLLLVAPAVFLTSAAQGIGWIEGQVNASICTWSLARAALIRDTIFIDGGELYWKQGMEDGSYSGPETDSWIERLVWGFNVTSPIDSDTNVTELLSKNTLTRKSRNGLGANYQDGAMLANDDQFVLYGGSIQPMQGGYKAPGSDQILSYQLYNGDPEKVWRQDWLEGELSDKTDRWVTYGGAANAPSENRAWYFSGMTSPTHGEIGLTWAPDGEKFAHEVSKYLIEVDLADQGYETWTNFSLPNSVKGRANPELVWVPVGEEGILVALGGVVYPQWATQNQTSENEERSKEESPVFMKEIDIYDIAGRKWYKQESTGSPGTRTKGCAVLAPASDYSSFNIYYYGGFDGINAVDAFDDDVWVLSLPSFTWTRLNDGTESHARAGHKCFRPYGDQMLVFGGYRSLPGGRLNCLDPGPFVFFNMTSGDWMDDYSPNDAGEYGVPDKVVSVIGGDAAGRATLTTPAPSGWANDDLEELFSQTYDMDKISVYGPFTAAESSTGQADPPGDDDDDEGGGGGLPSWVAPVLGVVLGLMVVTGALVVFFLWRKRKIFRNNPNATSSDASTEDTGKRIRQWMRGQHGPQVVEKAPTMTTSETPASPEPEMRSVSAMRTDTQGSPPPDATIFYETAGNPVAELPDNSLAELSDAQSDQFMQRHSQIAEYNRGLEANSTVSGSSGPAAAAENPESPVTYSHGNYRLSDPGHMRSLSETLAGPFGLNMSESQNQEQGGSSRPSLTARRQSQASDPPVSPPTSGDVHADDYMTARSGIVSPVMRKSVFHESEEDMEKK